MGKSLNNSETTERKFIYGNDKQSNYLCLWNWVFYKFSASRAFWGAWAKYSTTPIKSNSKKIKYICIFLNYKINYTFLKGEL